MPDKSTLARIEVNTKRLKRLKLKLMNVHVPEKLFQAYKKKLARDRLTGRQVLTAMLELYTQGGFTVEKEKDQVDKK